MLATALLANGCGLPDPAAQLHDVQEFAAEEQPDRGKKLVKQSALLISGASLAGCLLIAKMRKLCADIVASRQSKKHQSIPSTKHSLHEELTTLRQEYEEFRDYYNVVRGKQANINGFVFETQTVQALYKIIPDLYEGEQVKKIVRNVEGSYAEKPGRNKDFEIDAIVITTKRVFVIETKLTLKRGDIDRLITLLENFHQLKFAAQGLRHALRSKPVHGGFSYLTEAKTATAGARSRRASKYAQQHRLLTIPRLSSDKSTPRQVAELQDFR